jgi:hypothetical protein
MIGGGILQMLSEDGLPVLTFIPKREVEVTECVDFLLEVQTIL